MPRFAANVSLMYAEHAFLDRFAAAAADGFDAVEMQFPYAFDAAEVAARIEAAGLEMVLMNTPPGDFDAGERGLAALPHRRDDFRRAFERAVAYAEVLRSPRIHVMAGIVAAAVDRPAMRSTFLENLAWASAQAPDRTLLVEPINTRDIPGYFVNRQDHGHELVAELGRPNVKVMFDLYHCQVVEGDLASKLKHYLPGGRVGHLQFAGVPERQEPDVGELNYRYLFELIDHLGWTTPIGAEYKPRGATSAGLGWFQPWRRR